MLRDQVSHNKVTEAKDRNFTQSIRIVTFSISIFSKRADQHFRLKKVKRNPLHLYISIELKSASD